MINVRQKNKRELVRQIIIIFIMLDSLGIPGNAASIVGLSAETYLGYISFIAQIYLMLMTTAESFLDIRVVNLKKKYWPIYMMLLVFFVDSMIVTNDQKLQFISCFRFSTIAFFALWLADQYSLEDVLYMFVRAIYVYFALTFVYSLLYPSDAYSYAEGGFRGLVSTKNSAAFVYVFCVTVMLVDLKIRLHRNETIDRRFLIVLIGTSIMMIMCNSTGANITLIVVAAFILSFSDWKNKKWRFRIDIMYIAASVGFVIFALTILQLFAPILELMGKDATLTGRVPMWKRIIYVMQQSHALTGYGFSMFWRNDRAVELIHAGFREFTWLATMTSGAHNVLMDLWLNVGIFGIASYFFALIMMFRRPQENQADYYLFSAAYMIIFCFHGFQERAFVPYNFQMLSVFFVMATATKKAEK